MTYRADSKAGDILIYGAAVVTVDTAGTILDPGWVYTRGNRIVEVGAGQPPSRRISQASEVIKGDGCAVMPGMTNAHTHLFQAFFRGLADDKTLLDWLRDCIWPGAVHIDSEIAEDAAALALVENLRGGATTVIDHQYVHTNEAADESGGVVDIDFSPGDTSDGIGDYESGDIDFAFGDTPDGIGDKAADESGEMNVSHGDTPDGIGDVPNGIGNESDGVDGVDGVDFAPGDGDIDDLDDAVCSAADRLGLRFLLAHGWADRNYHPALAETASTALTRAGAAHRRWDGRHDDRIRVELGPLIPWGCSDEAMRTTVAEARSWGRGTHIHCAETAIEVQMSLDERDLRHVDWLDSLGVLGNDTTLAHSVWLSDDELDRIASAGAVVVHCPVSNMYLASGVARVKDMRDRGITVALASDGPGSNNRQDMFEVLKATVLLAKVHHLDAVVLQPEDVLAMACRGGSAAFGMPGSFGTIAKGQRADLVVVDLRSPFVMPVHRVASALVYNATPRDVRDVVVDGRILLRDGELVVADERLIIEKAEAAARRLFLKAGINSRLTQP